MACYRMLAVLAVLSLAISAHCQDAQTPVTVVSTQTQVVNRLVPVTARVVNTGVGAIGKTPAAPAGRKLLQTIPTFGPTPAVLSPGFSKTILPIIRKTNTLAFLGQAKQEFGTDKVGYTFIFGEEAQPFLKSLAVSGSDFTFVGTSAILPADQNAVTVPNSQFSATGFVSADGSATTALVTTQTPSGVIPNVALRFDYTQTVGTPAISIYYTDRRAPFVNGGFNATGNLAQSFGVYIAPDGTVYPGQG
ncbi:hypothetical protein COCSUDRAFT_49127 [Coccomyxa subellipsoidea C-169]|uniref:Uncharacterized protein n=1 Tax=Coccomyxa subellipsoidea (strain C-169) TaxID=574566 RepID=I0YKN7_COCSC|nr:hypothetical protein COCSUDRAFT_49127 [Coccomyxa subellipsoidea C-169]EIE18956.1 hypothetical protein COCSUDRAFT_49127 [Coccomyxa subellipsoidea C-169]|eukprot:XP_005643500.1 hypothetical protein COCSUDRAFT_49127 [Coccomyxa subellipsoidea C-169]